MARDWEETFSTWYGPASNAEQTRYENTRKAINEALRMDSRLDDYTFDVYAKGSYPAYTNVVADSDVDIAVELTSFNSNEFVLDAEGLTLADVGVEPYTGDASLGGFKNDVEAVLVEAFGAAAVNRGNKAIHIREDRSSLKADVVPCVTHRTWLSATSQRTGTRLQNDARPADIIVNYPKQHLEEGTKKNDAVSLRYKRVVRILKRLENEMAAKDVIEAVPSFLIESAVYNAPDDYFGGGTWTARVRAALAYIYDGTNTDACVASNDWLEVSRCKFLFASGQSWTRETANDFTLKAWGYLGLGS
ncbi:MAG: nucleotidyltransferase [Actinobacteria bacterium]|nr:nucleotidyltransferase [Actinomycetota bacterium]